MPDATVVAALGALLTVLVFLNGFVSVRLHGYHERALDRIREIDDALTAQSPVPYFQLEARERELRGQPLPPLTGLVLLSASLVLGAVLAVAVIASTQAEDAAQRTAVWLTAGAGVLIFGITVLDHVLLRRRLRRRLDELPLAQLAKLERDLWAAAVYAGNARSRDDLKVATIFGRVYIAHDAALAAEYDEDVIAHLRKRDAHLHELEERLHAESSSSRDRYTGHLDRVVDGLRQILRRPGLDSWPRARGCRAVARLYRSYGFPDWAADPSDDDVTLIRQDLEIAVNNDPNEPRWLWAMATLDEAIGNVEDAACWSLSAAQLDYSDVQALPLPLGVTPVGMVAATEAYLAYPQPERASTYLAALRRATGAADDTALESHLQILALDLLRVSARPGKYGYNALDWTPQPCLDALRSLVERLLDRSELGWYSAEHLISMSRSRLADEFEVSAVRNLRAGIDDIDSTHVQPARAAWYAARGGQQASVPPETLAN